VKLCLRI